MQCWILLLLLLLLVLLLVLVLLFWGGVKVLMVLGGGMLGGGVLGGMRGLLSLLIDDSCQLWKPDRSRRTGRACRLGWTPRLGWDPVLGGDPMLGQSPMLCCSVSLRRCAAGPTQDASQQRNAVVLLVMTIHLQAKVKKHCDFTTRQVGRHGCDELKQWKAIASHD